MRVGSAHILQSGYNARGVSGTSIYNGATVCGEQYDAIFCA